MRLVVCFLSLLTAFGPGKCGNVLVWFTEGSHWINLKIVLETLIDRGHNVTVLVPDASLFMHAKESDRFSYQPFNVSISAQDIEDSFEDFLHFSLYEMEQLNLLQIYIKFYQLFSKDLDLCFAYCDGTLKSRELMDKLQHGKFNVMLSDPIYPCSEALAEKLNIPIVYTLRFSIANTLERMCGQIPAPPSFVPGTMSKLTDKMSFTERIKNMLFYLSQDALAISLWKKVDKYYTEYFGRPTSFCEMTAKADIWLIRTYWDFEFPRPFLPNFKYVGGLHCTPAKPLPKDMEEFVQSSGDDGIVVFTLGSLVNNMTKDRSNTIASALAQIPQKVLWRYDGEKPDTLSENTRIYKWIPQNDLLGHPKTRAFITHGGTNGIYEAIYHGVPMVGIPLFGDQPDNLVHMKAKGAAVIMHFNSMQIQDLVDGLNAVINDPSYKENAMRLSRIHHDRPIKPLDETVFWIEFVMRNKVLVLDPSPFTKESNRFSYQHFSVYMTTQDMQDFLNELVHFSVYETDQLNLLQIQIKLYELASKHQDIGLSYCDGILKSPKLMDKMRNGKFDVVLSEPHFPCSDIVAEELNVPLVYTFQFSIAHIVERMCGQIPSPPSFVPAGMIKLTDKMSFTERIINMLFYLSQDAFAILVWKRMDNYYTEYFGRPTSSCEMMGKADIWLIRTYWDFEFPRPFLPNFKYVGGLHCTPAKPLPKDMQEFVQSSGDDGIVVFTLGSMIDKMPKETSNMIASALAQIPQKESFMAIRWR
ncbi:hypothetical protein G5714_006378 [Onychostoma macrolepis]|uniref:glucuronosyltransferase n=1 Tax=Onychostoma macrolepis TaxID=369639 RepID=A0A7J6D3N7_9TELE|nr:hypothetical protein G5714_006378 [Onychostoma macrolepis]